jgi:hypothetical protein
MTYSGFQILNYIYRYSIQLPVKLIAYRMAETDMVESLLTYATHTVHIHVYKLKPHLRRWVSSPQMCNTDTTDKL